MKPRAGATPAAGLTYPCITIVIPAVGADEYLEATLRSIIYQDYPNLEFIVIEDSGPGRHICHENCDSYFFRMRRRSQFPPYSVANATPVFAGVYLPV